MNDLLKITPEGISPQIQETQERPQPPTRLLSLWLNFHKDGLGEVALSSERGPSLSLRLRQAAGQPTGDFSGKYKPAPH